MNTTPLLPVLLPLLILGLLTGFRAFTPLALLCWVAHFGWLPLAGTPLAFLGSIITAILVTVIALGELVNDKRPEAGNRTAPGPLIGRIIIAGLCASAVLLAAPGPMLPGILAGALGAILGAFGGFHARRTLVRGMHFPDFAVALVEDAISIAGAYLVLAHLS